MLFQTCKLSQFNLVIILPGPALLMASNKEQRIRFERESDLVLLSDLHICASYGVKYPLLLYTTSSTGWIVNCFCVLSELVASVTTCLALPYATPRRWAAWRCGWRGTWPGPGPGSGAQTWIRPPTPVRSSPAGGILVSIYFNSKKNAIWLTEY